MGSFFVGCMLPNPTNSRRDCSSKLHLTPIKYAPQLCRPIPLIPQLRTPTNVVPQKDEPQDRPLNLVKYSPPVSPSLTQNSSNAKPRPSSIPVTRSISAHSLQRQQRIHSSSPALPPQDGNSYNPRPDSPSDLSTAHVPTSDISDEPRPYPEPKKPLRALASFLGGFLETARNATQLQASVPSLHFTKHKRTKGASSRPYPASRAGDLTQNRRNVADSDQDRRFSTPYLQPLGSMRPSTQKFIQNPGSPGPESTRQQSSPVESILLRSLTAHPHPLLESVKQKSFSSLGAGQMKCDGVMSGPPSDPRITGSVAPPMNSKPSNASPSRSLPQHQFSGSRPLQSTTPSPQQILAALQPPTAQVVLSCKSPFELRQPSSTKALDFVD